MGSNRLAHLVLYFDPKDVKTEREEGVDVYYIECDIKDELFIWPSALDDEKVEIEFDGGCLTMSRATFLKLIEEYNQEYERRIGLKQVEYLLNRIEKLKINEKAKKVYMQILEHLKKDLLGR